MLQQPLGHDSAQTLLLPHHGNSHSHPIWAPSTRPQVLGVAALGVLNLVGVGMLTGLLTDPRGPALLAMQGLGFVVALMRPLQLYAAAFFVLPAIRCAGWWPPLVLVSS